MPGSGRKRLTARRPEGRPPAPSVLEEGPGGPLTTATAWFLGLLLGMRHALEPDHLAAVSTLVTERGDSRSGLWLGAYWGLGHTLALLVMGAVLAVFRTTLSARTTVAFELGVSVMLLFLGVRALIRARAEMARGAPHRHAHRGLPHVHAGHAAHVHLGHRAFALRPLLVGLVHGLAGSGALTALVLAGFDTNTERLAYILVFGGGSVLGMGLLSGLAGWPLARLMRTPRARAWSSAAAGMLSVTMGLLWGWPLVPQLLQ
jgi:ABC-type nickel/cobalt efflux system permease component RcnA